MSLRKIIHLLCGVVLCLSAMLYGCEAFRNARPILPVREYERMIMGRLDANYVGTENCLKACHYHDKIRKYFEGSTMGAQLSPDSGMPIVDCESCHGPGSLAIEGLTREKVEEDRSQGKQTACDYKTLLDLENLPAGAKSLICLKCHSKHALFNLHNWSAGVHSQNDVSCSDCHATHKGIDLTTSPREVEDMCLNCHRERRVEFTLPSHHAVLERRVFCNDCHEPHGSITDKLQRKATLKETCAQCHTEKTGPFLFEHADLTENCTTCHNPHGSVNNNLLKVREPFLCLQCHNSHQLDNTLNSMGRSHTRCTDCHPKIHGTDIPSSQGGGRFTQ